MELYSYRRRNLDRAGMVPWEQLTKDRCGCPNNCQSSFLESVLKARFAELCDCESLKDENVVVSRLLYDNFGQRTIVCLPFLESWLLLPRHHAEKLLELMATALEYGLDLRDGYAFVQREVEGDTDSDLVLVRRGGSNKIPEALFQRIADAYHLYSRPLPEQPFARLTQSDVNSLPKLRLKAVELSLNFFPCTLPFLLSRTYLGGLPLRLGWCFKLLASSTINDSIILTLTCIQQVESTGCLSC
jgi:hypothetical protein